ncbi:ankyrin repeat domain-containing protein [Serratia rhizosphaerae]
MKKIEPEEYFTGQQLILAKAIEAGDLGRVKQLAPETDLNTPGEQDLTLLFFALNETYYNNNPKPRLQIVTALVKAGADPLQPLPRGMASPAEMVSMGDKDLWLQALLDGGLSANAKNKQWGTAIIFDTLRAKNTATLALLIERGVNIDSRNSLEETPLMAAFLRNRFEHVNYLLDHGADPNPVNKQGWVFASLVQNAIKDSRPETEYHQNCLQLRDKMIALGVKWPPEA